ncbi:MAG: hypothetical protein ACTSV2_12460 [Candidatus Thorarchaeota archaeon]
MTDKKKGYSTRRYYAHRKGHYPFLNFGQIKDLFVKDILNYMVFEKHLLEAEGYRGHDSSMIGTWGRDIPSFILKQLQMVNIWPFRENIEKYDLTTFFTVIEFIYDYVSIPEIKKNKIISSKKDPARKDYRERVNELLTLYCHRYSDINREHHEIFYELSTEGEIREKVKNGFKKLVEEIPLTDDPENIDNKVRYAVSHFLRYGATKEEKKDAIRTLGDILEFLKKSGIIMPKPDDNDLFQILNRFSIRHHEKSQKSNYSLNEWYEFFFYLFLSSITVLLKLYIK